MKTTVISTIVCALAALTSMQAWAQSNIKSAFDAIINCKDAQVKEQHSLDRNPETGEKTGQSDVYFFTLPADKMKLVDNAVASFKRDDSMAYGIYSGTLRESGEIAIAAGNDESRAVYIGESGDDYTYALFLAPRSEDPTGAWRYAYSISYKRSDGEVKGKIVITYATTLQYRQEQKQKAYEQMFNIPSVSGSGTSWFSKLMSYFQSMTSGSTQARVALATKAYELIKKSKNYPDVTDTDKDAAREIIKSMLNERKYNTEPVLRQLLNSCLTALK